MKKKMIILISIVIIFLIISILLLKNQTKTIEGNIIVIGDNYLLVSTDDNIDYIINTKNTEYIIGDKLRIEINNLNRNEEPYEANAKSISIISKFQKDTNKEEHKNEDITEMYKPSIDDHIETGYDYTDNDIIDYFEDLKNKIINYNNEYDMGKEIKDKFVMGIDFIFYDKSIGGKTFKELRNATKLNVLQTALEIDSKIDVVFPKYKESIGNSYQNIKNKFIALYLDITTDICNNDQQLCNNAKSSFNDLKENFDITWEMIKELSGNGLSKLKDWYEIWRYN